MNKHTSFGNNNFYHIYNRGVDKRSIVIDEADKQRFLQSLVEFNSQKPIGSIYEHSFQLGRVTSKLKLVNIVAYCLNPNHYHLILEQLVDGGITEFMKRLGGYTKYFNIRNKRSGVLFQGTFKFKHIDFNDYLLRASAYVNLNFRVHRLGYKTSKSSWEEYIGNAKNKICITEIVLSQFNNRKEYKKIAEEALADILCNKEKLRELENE